MPNSIFGDKVYFKNCYTIIFCSLTVYLAIDTVVNFYILWNEHSSHWFYKGVVARKFITNPKYLSLKKGNIKNLKGV